MESNLLHCPHFTELGPGYGSAGGGPGEAPWGQGLLMSAGDAALEVRWGR